MFQKKKIFLSYLCILCILIIVICIHLPLSASTNTESGKPFFCKSIEASVTDESPNEYTPSTARLDYSYKGQLHNEKRYLAIGFDDFRESDFSLIIPLLEKYNFRATFNKIHAEDFLEGTTDLFLTEEEKGWTDIVLYGGHELGDHTIMHINYLYSDPLCNGQDPSNPDGNQTPYPTNDQIRTDRGDGKNVFGMDLSESTSSFMYFDAFDVPFKDLTDEQCQVVREYFSIMKDTEYTQVLDLLSNNYLGTTGSSAGSWNDELGCYTGGIFTGCKTSANHEVWERILQITQLLLKDQYGLNYDFQTWSWPGHKQSPFLYEKNGEYFYDEACTMHANYLAKMTSSLTGESRSWTDVLRNFGYTITHDYIYPSRIDGQTEPMMSKQFIYNASVSRKDAVLYPTNYSIPYSSPGEAYAEDFFSGEKSKAAQMYDDGGNFYTFIESIRQNTSNGMIHGELIDSVDEYSERVFMEELLRYCKQTGVEVITKAEAYDLCFNHKLYYGNLIYNPKLRNTAKEFMPDAENIPDNPDGYTGDCYVSYDENYIPTLNVSESGCAEYLHYGVPIGTLTFQLEAKGASCIEFYAIRNSDSIALDNSQLVKVSEIQLTNPDNFETYCVDFLIKDYPLTEFEDLCEGYGDKIMGIKIVYGSGISAKNMSLVLN